MELLAEDGIPSVGSCEGFDHVVTNNLAEMIRQGTRHLLKEGRRKIALQLWISKIPNLHEDNLIRTFKDEMAAWGTPVHQEWIVQDLPPAIPGNGFKGFKRIWEASDEKPDAVFICDDNYFRDAAMCILKTGARVPEDLMVATISNKGSGIMSPFPVAKLECDPDEYAKGIVDALLALMRREKPPMARRFANFDWRISDKSDYEMDMEAPETDGTAQA